MIITNKAGGSGIKFGERERNGNVKILNTKKLTKLLKIYNQVNV